ncbi:hypothetical protein Tco_0734823, partial [Tanacetum coccineum]
QILNTQAKARKEENYKTEDLCGMIKKLERRSDRMLYLKNMSWIPCFDDLRALIMHESNKSKYSIHPTSDRNRLNREADETILEGICLETWSTSFDHLRSRYYANVRRKPLEFQVGDRVMLKVSPWKGMIRFSKRGKLNPCYIGPFKILAKVGTVAYRLELPEQLSRVHSTIHVSNLKKCLSDETLAIPLDEIQIDVHWNSRRGLEFT